MMPSVIQRRRDKKHSHTNSPTSDNRIPNQIMNAKLCIAEQFSIHSRARASGSCARRCEPICLVHRPRTQRQHHQPTNQHTAQPKPTHTPLWAIVKLSLIALAHELYLCIAHTQNHTRAHIRISATLHARACAQHISILNASFNRAPVVRLQRRLRTPDTLRAYTSDGCAVINGRKYYLYLHLGAQARLSSLNWSAV